MNEEECKRSSHTHQEEDRKLHFLLLEIRMYKQQGEIHITTIYILCRDIYTRIRIINIIYLQNIRFIHTYIHTHTYILYIYKKYGIDNNNK